MTATEEIATQYEKALRLVRELFADRRRVPFSEIQALVEANDIGYSTIRRARIELGIQAVRNGGKPGFWERA